MPYPDSSAAIPAAAVEAATQALRANPNIPDDVQALLMLEAALPYIREQIARDIEALTVRGPDNRMRHVNTVRSAAARIARDGAE